MQKTRLHCYAYFILSTLEPDLSPCFCAFSQAPLGLLSFFSAWISAAHLSHHTPVRTSSLGVLCCCCHQDIGHIRFFSLTGSLLKNLTPGRSLGLTQTPAQIFPVAPIIKQKILPMDSVMKMMCFLTAADHRYLTNDDDITRCGIVSPAALLR